MDPETLEAAAATVRVDLDLDRLLGDLGTPHLVGSAALGLMVWPDLDLTVFCERVDVGELYSAATSLVVHPRVRQLTVRNDTGRWNTDPVTYPDGIYWGVDYRDEQRRWNIDIWFVTDAERQPDLQHIREIAPRLTAETRSAILEIKRAWFDRPEYRGAVTSLDIYTAVLDHGVRSVAEFNRRLENVRR